MRLNRFVVLTESNSDKSFFSFGARHRHQHACAIDWSNLDRDNSATIPMCAAEPNAKRHGRQNPAAAVSMGSGMLNGLKGLSMQLFDLNINPDAQFGEVFSQMDGMFTLSAKDPKHVDSNCANASS
nr:hypothetical protein [Vibrio parahaemolyticus]